MSRFGESLRDIAKRQLTDGRQEREVARVLEDYSDRIVAQIWASLEGRLEAATQEQRWEADYRQAVIRELDHVDLFGADLPPEPKRNLLSDTFRTKATKQCCHRSRSLTVEVLRCSDPPFVSLATAS